VHDCVGLVMMNCPRCKKEWAYDGKKKFTARYPQYVNCPRCKTSIKLVA
jgi:transposase-like protein